MQLQEFLSGSVKMNVEKLSMPRGLFALSVRKHLSDLYIMSLETLLSIFQNWNWFLHNRLPDFSL